MPPCTKRMGRHPSLRNRALNARKGVEHYWALGVNYILGQVIGHYKMAFPVHFQAGLRREAALRVEAACDRRKSALVKAYKAAFFLRRHSSAVISQISDGKRPET